MVILSLFDGCSIGQKALYDLGIRNYKYYASEIDKYAIKSTQKNFPNTIQVGDVTKVSGKDFDKIDLLIGGSPCQGFSFAGKQLNFKDHRSKLFFEYVRILKELRENNPDIKFLLENVLMKEDYIKVISDLLGQKPRMINSSIFTAQSRKRLYWDNFKLPAFLPEDKGIVLKDILENKVKEKYFVNSGKMKGNQLNGKYKSQANTIYPDSGKSQVLAGVAHGYAMGYIKTNNQVRKLTPIECERLQGLPDNYTEGVSDTQRYKMLGNGFTKDVIEWILSHEYR